MEKTEGEKFESKETFGCNVTIEVDLIRHAEKSGFYGALSERGKKEAFNFGQKTPGKVYYSPMKRARETGEEMEKSSSYAARERNILGPEVSDAYIEKYFQKTKENRGDESEALQIYIDTNDVRPDEQTLSSKEVSGRLLEAVSHLVRMSKKLKRGSNVRTILVSHSGMIEHVLVDLLEEKREGFVENIGGALDFLEGAKFIIHRDESGQPHVSLEFRGKEKNLDKFFNG